MNFYFYRLPGQEQINGSKSSRISTDQSIRGFMIVPFDKNNFETYIIPAEQPITINELPELASQIEEDSSQTASSFFPSRSTSLEEYNEMIKETVTAIGKGHLEKCVISRAIIKPIKLDVASTFLNLCKEYPSAYVFCFYTSATGLWMGASPEVLLNKSGKHLTTMALAGTQPADSNEEWDDKNIEEHNVVLRYIVEKFKELSADPKSGPTYTVKAGPVKHLRTDITGFSETLSLPTALKLATNLSPTPALSGFPKEKAILHIENTEPHTRANYGGFVGEITENGDFSFYVNLRSMLIKKDGVCIFSGGGIMGDSDCAKEWEETERKSRTLLNCIVEKK